MKFAFFTRSVASSLFCASLLDPAFAQRPAGSLAAQSRPVEVPFSAVVETIEFEGVSPEMQKLVLDRIGLRVGDMLTVDARNRIGRELGKVQTGMTFTYKSGSKLGTAKLTISADC